MLLADAAAHTHAPAPQSARQPVDAVEVVGHRLEIAGELDRLVIGTPNSPRRSLSATARGSLKVTCLGPR